eukprot:jgi/Mesen1/6142/ME000314S05145
MESEVREAESLVVDAAATPADNVGVSMQGDDEHVAEVAREVEEESAGKDAHDSGTVVEVTPEPSIVKEEVVTSSVSEKGENLEANLSQQESARNKVEKSTAEVLTDERRGDEKVPLLEKDVVVQQSSWGWSSWTSMVTAIQEVATEVSGEISKTAAAAARSITESLEDEETAAQEEAQKIIAMEASKATTEGSAGETLVKALAEKDNVEGEHKTEADASDAKAEGAESKGDKEKVDLQQAVKPEAKSSERKAQLNEVGGLVGKEATAAVTVEGSKAEAENSEKERSNGEVEMRDAAMGKLESVGSDTVLSQGLKMIDESVGSLTTGTFSAFDSAWRGGISFVHSLEQHAHELAHSIQDGKLSARAHELGPQFLEGSKDLAEKSMKMLEYVGKETVDILAKEAGIQLEDEDQQQQQQERKQRDEAPPEEEEGEAFEEEEVTFDHCFYIYGGPEHLEELEALASHHTLLCNRARSKLPPADRAAFDALLADLQAILTLANDALLNEGGAAATAAGAAGTGAGAGTSELESGKGKGKVEGEDLEDDGEVKALREAGISKAAELANGFSAGLAGLSMGEVVQRTVDRIEALKAEASAQKRASAAAVAAAATPGPGSDTEPSPEPVAAAAATTASGTAGTDEAIRANGASGRGGDVEEWALECKARARALRTGAQAMVADINVVIFSFVTGITDVVAAFQEATSDRAGLAPPADATPDGAAEKAFGEILRAESIASRSSALRGDLTGDGLLAKHRMEDGLRHLVFVVLSTNLRS